MSNQFSSQQPAGAQAGGQAIHQAIKQTAVQEKPHGLVAFLLYIVKGCVYLALLTPLIVNQNFFFPFVGPKSLYFMGLAEIIIFCWLGLMILSKEYRPKRHPVLTALALFLFIMILSGALGLSPSYSFWSKPERMTGILMFFHLIGFFLALITVFKKEEQWRRVLSGSVFVAIIVSILSLGGWGGSTRGGATIGNTSFMGTYLLLNVFLAVYLFFRSFGRVGDYFNQKENIILRIFSGFGFVMITWGIFTSTARAAILSFLGGLYLLLIFYLAFKPKIKWLKIAGKIILALSIIAALIAVLMIFQEGSFVRNKFVETASKSRLVVWEKAWKGFQERPLLGWGQENFEFVFLKFYNPCMALSECGGEIWFDRAHNVIFDTLSANGLLGFLAYSGIFISLFWVLWKKYLQDKIDFWVCAAPTALLIAYSTQNLTVFDMISSYLMFFLVLAFVVSLTSQAKPLQAQARSQVQARAPNAFLGSGKKAVLFALPLVFIFAFAWFVIQPAYSSHFVIKALTAQTTQEHLDYYQKSFDTSEVGLLQIREFLGGHTQNTLNDILGSDKSLEDFNQETLRAELDLVVEELNKSVQAVPLDFRSLLRLSNIYYLYGFIDKEKIVLAEETARKMVEVSPTNQQGYWSLAQILILQTKYQEAIEYILRPIDLEPNLFTSYQIAKQAIEIAEKHYQEQGNEEELKFFQDKEKELLEKASAINPDWQEQLSQM